MGNTGYTLGHRPALDGLRGVAVLIVVAAHAGAPLLRGDGYIGVQLFFALSGFLITALLIEEQDATGVSVRLFYGRRAVRLLPALALMVTVVGVLLPATGRGSAWLVVPAVGYFSNIATMAVDLGPLEHTWSLSLEEQFYVLWPAAFLVFGLWRRHPAVVWVAAAAMTALRHLDTPSGLFDVVASADGLVAGCALALTVYRSGRAPAPTWARTMALAGLSAAVLVWVPPHHPDRRMLTTLVAWASVALVGWAIASPPRWLQGRALRWVGRRSYAIYLWQTPIIWFDPLGMGPGMARFLVYGAAALAAGELSWQLVERHGVALRRRLRPASGDSPDPQHGVDLGAEVARCAQPV